jgi:hypothetical protein
MMRRSRAGSVPSRPWGDRVTEEREAGAPETGALVSVLYFGTNPQLAWWMLASSRSARIPAIPVRLVRLLFAGSYESHVLAVPLLSVTSGPDKGSVRSPPSRPSPVTRGPLPAGTAERAPEPARRGALGSAE